jgi:hypothetical protein
VHRTLLSLLRKPKRRRCEGGTSPGILTWRAAKPRTPPTLEVGTGGRKAHPETTRSAGKSTRSPPIPRPAAQHSSFRTCRRRVNVRGNPVVLSVTTLRSPWCGVVWGTKAFIMSSPEAPGGDCNLGPRQRKGSVVRGRRRNLIEERHDSLGPARQSWSLINARADVERRGQTKFRKEGVLKTRVGDCAAYPQQPALYTK